MKGFDCAGAVHMESHHTKVLPTDLHDLWSCLKHIFLLNSRQYRPEPKFSQQPTSSRRPLSINYRTVGYEVYGGEPRCQASKAEPDI